MTFTSDEIHEFIGAMLNLSITISGGWDNGYKVEADLKHDSFVEVGDLLGLPFSVQYMKDGDVVPFDKCVISNDKVKVTMLSCNSVWKLDDRVTVNSADGNRQEELHLEHSNNGWWHNEIRQMFKTISDTHNANMEKATGALKKAGISAELLYPDL